MPGVYKVQRVRVSGVVSARQTALLASDSVHGRARGRIPKDTGRGEEDHGPHYLVTSPGTARAVALCVCNAQLVWRWATLRIAVSPPVLAEGAGHCHPLWVCGGPGRAPAHG